MRIFCLFTIIICVSSVYGLNSSEANDNITRSFVEGTLVQISKLPSATESAYPDCYYTASLDIKQIISGPPIPQKVVLVIPGFFSRIYAPEAKFKIGDKVLATLIPFESMPDKIRQTQQADEIEDVTLKFYFPEKVDLIQAFQRVDKPAPFAGNERDVEGKVEFQQSDAGAKAARKESIRRDLAQINKLLADHGGDWDKWHDSLKDFRTQYDKQFEAKAHKWVGDSFFSAGYLDHFCLYNAKFVQSVIAFKNYLAARNVDLILVRVPTKGEVVADLFAPLPLDKINNPDLLRMYKELLEADVEIITDVIPRARESRLKYPLMYWYQDFPEVEPAEGIAWVVAEEFAKRLNRYERIRNTPKKTYTLREVSGANYEYLRWPEGNPKFDPAEQVRFASVTNSDGSVLKLTQGADSTVLVVGSSFIGHPSIEKGGSIPPYLAYLTGIAPDIVYRSGSDRTIPRSIAREGDKFLRNRSVCLFPFVPSTAYQNLLLPPIVDLDKAQKTLLASYEGNDLRAQIQPSSKVPEHVFSYSPDGSLVIRPENKQRGAAGSIRITLPRQISSFPYFIVEIDFASKDLTNIVAKYSGQQDAAYRSNTQTKSSEIFLFEARDNYAADIDFTNSVINNNPTILRGVKIYGVKQ